VRGRDLLLRRGEGREEKRGEGQPPNLKIKLRPCAPFSAIIILQSVAAAAACRMTNYKNCGIYNQRDDKLAQ